MMISLILFSCFTPINIMIYKKNTYYIKSCCCNNQPQLLHNYYTIKVNKI